MKRISEIPRLDRPREKLEKYGPEKLTNAELLAILLRVGRKGVNAVELAKRILKHFDRPTIAEAGVEELKKISGLGSAKACEIVACFELGRRFLCAKPAALILSPRDAWQQLKDIRESRKEHFVVFYLDIRNREIQREIVSVGTLSASLVHPREVFESAIVHHCAQILVAHNHPSGQTDPSEEDLTLTRRLVEAGKLLGIEVLDHVIVSKTGYQSLREQGAIDS